MIPSIRPVIRELAAADTFEAAAEAVLRPMLARAAGVLAASPYGRRGRVLRGMVHLRPAGGYRGLVVLEHGLETHSRIPQDDTLLPSATVWRWLEAEGRPISVDVQLATVAPLGGEPVRIQRDGDELEADVFTSRARLLDRDATHLLVLPLSPVPGQPTGMISLEVHCAAAMGRPFIWSECAEELELLATLAAPYLLSRPPRSGVEVSGDELLPVVGRSMEGVVHLLRVFAQQPETILICGPTGAGKSRLARWCHARSARREGPFEIVDLQTVPPETQMAELFGWKKGAFTGAIRDHAGGVARADGGTLFLDEIDKLSLSAQAGLLALLEERRYRVLGDPTGARRADVRFIVGTNADLRELVKSGRFREDLYYRINVLPVHLPPLSERVDEIPAWAAFMVGRRHREAGLPGPASITVEAGRVLARFSWPGNLRQLDNVIRRAYAMALAEGGVLGPAVLEVDVRHVERALAFEHSGDDGSLLSTLRRAARAYALEAERRRGQEGPGESGGRLGLELADAFPALVLSAGVTLTGNLKDAFLLYGLNRLVESRNHQQTFERMQRKLAGALEAMGEVPDGDLPGSPKVG